MIIVIYIRKIIVSQSYYIFELIEIKFKIIILLFLNSYL